MIKYKIIAIWKLVGDATHNTRIWDDTWQKLYPFMSAIAIECRWSEIPLLGVKDVICCQLPMTEVAGYLPAMIVSIMRSIIIASMIVL